MISHIIKLEVETYVEKVRSSALFKQAQSGKLDAQAVAQYVANLRYLFAVTETCQTLARRRALANGHARLANYFAHKRDEELGHDQWAVEDLGRLNATFGVSAPAEPLEAIAELVRYLERTIEAEPRCYLAYILLVEHLTAMIGPEWLAVLERQCGIPRSHLTAVDFHIEADTQHSAENFAELDTLVTDASLLEPLLATLRQSCAYLDAFTDEIAKNAESRRSTRDRVPMPASSLLSP